MKHLLATGVTIFALLSAPAVNSRMLEATARMEAEAAEAAMDHLAIVEEPGAITDCSRCDTTYEFGFMWYFCNTSGELAFLRACEAHNYGEIGGETEAFCDEYAMPEGKRCGSGTDIALSPSGEPVSVLGYCEATGTATNVFFVETQMPEFGSP